MDDPPSSRVVRGVPIPTMLQQMKASPATALNILCKRVNALQPADALLVHQLLLGSLTYIALQSLPYLVDAPKDD
ncbi:hypothetical protein [Deinococcus hopiensis]|nr:hypothetical protein [Deinococcus hopiensis]